MKHKFIILSALFTFALAACTNNEPKEDPFIEKVAANHDYLNDVFTFDKDGNCANVLKANFDYDTFKTKVLGYAWNDYCAYDISKETGKVDQNDIFWAETSGGGPVTIFFDKDGKNGTGYFFDNSKGKNACKSYEYTYGEKYNAVCFTYTDGNKLPPQYQFIKYEETEEGPALWAVEYMGNSGSLAEPSYHFVLVRFSRLSDDELSKIKNGVK
mgnify:FL=1